MIISSSLHTLNPFALVFGPIKFTTTMIRAIAVHLSTRDVPRARAFYTARGFTVNEGMTGEKHVGIVISDTIQLMLSEESVFATFSPRAHCDPSQHLEVLNCLHCPEDYKHLPA